MGRINTYQKVTRPLSSDVAIIDGGFSSGSTRIVALSDLAGELPGMISVEMHRNTFRGKNLGSVFTDAQKAAIKNGTFDDLYVGDYWSISGVTWRIADFDYWRGTGDSSCTNHHIVMMPDWPLYNYSMNDTKTTIGGYMGSKMYTEGLNQAKEIINTAFGSAYILNHREYLTNAVTDGHPSGGAWVDSTVELPNEIMIYGCQIFTSVTGENTIADVRTIENTELSMMGLRRDNTDMTRQTYWLRDVVSKTYFAMAHKLVGRAAYGDADYDYGVRPVFGLTGG